MKHSVSFAVNQGPRSYQEDRYFYKRIEEQELSGWILAVMDGHGGKTVAELCAQEIEKLFRITTSDDPEEVLRLLVAELNSQTVHFHEGSTLSIALILESSSQVSIAVLGDSPVVVFDKRGEPHVSPEHNIRSNIQERKSAEQRGGVCVGGYLYDIGGGNHGLQMSRALGDAYLNRVLSREPDIYTIKDPQWILVATDGLFDPGHQETEQLLKEIRDYARNQATANDLMAWAEKRGLYDNATAIVWC